MNEEAVTKTTLMDRIAAWAFNPFSHIGGAKALAVGLAVILAAGFVGSLGALHFDGVLDFHTGVEGPLWLSLCEGLINLIVIGISVALAGMILSKGRVRVLEVFGNQALARFPTLIIALTAFLVGYGSFSRELQTLVFSPTAESFASVKNLGLFVFMATVALLMLVWMVMLMYRAFAASCNVKGGRAVGAFVIAVFLGEMVSKLIWLSVAVPAMPSSELAVVLRQRPREQAAFTGERTRGTRGRGPQFSPEQAMAVWTAQAAMASDRLGLDEDMSGKLLAAYVAARESHQKGRESLSSGEGGGRGGYEGYRELAEAERDKLEMALNEFLSEEQTGEVANLLGSFSRQWDSLVLAIADFGLDENTESSALGHVSDYMAGYNQSRSAAPADGDEEAAREASREVRRELRDKLDANMAELLSEEQLAKWTASRSYRGGRG